MKFFNQAEFNILANNKGNLIAELKNNPGDIYLLWSHDRVAFKEITENPNEQGVVRVMWINNQGCRIQFRAHQSLAGKQKARTIMANAHFSIEDLEFILNRMKKGK